MHLLTKFFTVKRVTPSRRCRVHRSERGAMSVELALLLPLILATVGLSMTTGTFLWAKVQLGYYAAAAARSCTQPDVNGNFVTANVDTCVNAYLSAAFRSTPLLPWCSTPVVSGTLLPTPATLHNSKLLQVSIACHGQWNALAYALPGFTPTKTLDLTLSCVRPFSPRVWS